jgi:hypothetical protein
MQHLTYVYVKENMIYLTSLSICCVQSCDSESIYSKVFFINYNFTITTTNITILNKSEKFLMILFVSKKTYTKMIGNYT